MKSVEETSGFRQNIVDAPFQVAVGFDIAKHVQFGKTFDTVVVSGMGGSALPANLLSVYVADIETRFPETAHIHFECNRTYALPAHTKNQQSLHLVCSYSGNTEEALSCYHEAREAGLSVVGISSGGQLEELCKQDDVPHIKLPVPSPTFQPRMGSGYFIGAMLELCMNHGMLPDIREEVQHETKLLIAAQEELERAGRAMAERLVGKTPVIYASSQYAPVARVWKIKINENAKTPAFWNFFPELNHNEMVGYTLPQAQFYLIMLKDPSDNAQNQKRYETMLGVVAEKGVEGEVVDMQEGSVYNKVFRTLLLGDFVAYYLALLYDQDPEPVDMVEAFKKLL